MVAGNLSECELYDKLSRFVMPPRELRRYTFPFPDSDEPSRCEIPKNASGQTCRLAESFVNPYECYLCKTSYKVDLDTGASLPASGRCNYHYLREDKRYGIYICCNKSKPCTWNDYHVNRGETLLQNYKGFVKTHDKPDRGPNKHGIYAIDCEMSYTAIGLELTRATVVNYKGQVIYDKIVKPETPVLNYNTETSGVSKENVDCAVTSLPDVQRYLLDLLSSNSIVVGHGLNHDMKKLKIFHEKYIDTSHLYPHIKGFPFKKSLKDLAREYLGISMHGNGGHDSSQDAIVALKLVLTKL